MRIEKMTAVHRPPQKGKKKEGKRRKEDKKVMEDR
jgi:hypothetical protein